ncbi:MAG: hypothetical protein PHN69_02640 [Candidatus Pacebacteria bacterium]|nr:hypothetical protein [Candidatus Paceibacterota bacterium]
MEKFSLINTTEQTIEKTEVLIEDPVTEDKPDKNKENEIRQEQDQQRLNEVREILSSETKNNGWRVERRPREEWDQKTEISTDHPLDRLGGWLKSFSKSERMAKKENERLQEDFIEDKAKYPPKGFVYKPGSGVEGMVGDKVGILATGFGECSGLVFQTPDKVSVVHISPNVFRGPADGGEIVKDTDIWGHIGFALKDFLVDDNEDKDTKKTEGETLLTKEEVLKLQRIIDSGTLKSTMFSGEDNFVPHEIASTLGGFAKALDLPFIKTDIHYVGAFGGGGGYAIYASPEVLYCIGANGKILKKDKNLPPPMYSYKERK